MLARQSLSLLEEPSVALVAAGFWLDRLGLTLAASNLFAPALSLLLALRLFVFVLDLLHNLVIALIKQIVVVALKRRALSTAMILLVIRTDNMQRGSAQELSHRCVRFRSEPLASCCSSRTAKPRTLL